MSTKTETRAAVSMAMGRIFGMLQRAGRVGDAEEYARCRGVILDALEGAPAFDTRPCYVRDRLRGAAGD